MDVPKAAIEISAQTKIPISTVYRRLQTLHDNKLLGISGSITTEGKKHFLYKSKVKAITTKFNGGNLEVEIIPNLPNYEMTNFLFLILMFDNQIHALNHKEVVNS
jgi:hypothetical protein